MDEEFKALQWEHEVLEQRFEKVHNLILLFNKLLSWLF